MRLKNVAKRFDNTTCVDAYSATTFKAQIEPLQIYSIDGAKVKRRVLSAAPEITIPARRTISIDGQVYLVGDDTPDQWADETLRVNYVLHGADHLATIRTIPEALADAAGFTAWAARDWSRDETDSRESAERINQYHIFFSRTEPVPDEAVLELDGRTYFVLAVHRSISGFHDALSNEVPGPAYETIAFGTRTYDPITDTYTDSLTNVRVLRLRWQEAFRYLTRASADFERGDSILMMLKAGNPTPKASDTLALSDGTFKVVSLLDEGAHYSLHVRRV